MSDRIAFFNYKSGSYQNSVLVVDIYQFICKHYLKILEEEPRPIEEISQSKVIMKICEYTKNKNLKF